MRDRITDTCHTAGCYVLSSDIREPRDVLASLLGALEILDPSTHRELTVPGGEYALIPAEALRHHLHPWWGTELADVFLQNVIGAINDAAPHGFACTFDGQSLVLARIDTDPFCAALRSTLPPSCSATRARVRPSGNS